MKKLLKSLLKDIIQDIFNEGWSQVNREMTNRFNKLDENLDRVEKNAERRYFEMRRVDRIIRKLDK